MSFRLLGQTSLLLKLLTELYFHRAGATEGWKFETLSATATDLGSQHGYKEIIARVNGHGAFASLRYCATIT